MLASVADFTGPDAPLDSDQADSDSFYFEQSTIVRGFYAGNVHYTDRYVGFVMRVQCARLTITGLHALLFQATQEDFESDVDWLAFPSLPPTQEADPTSLLEQNFSGCFISAVADDLVSKYGSEALKGVNRALDTWRRTWDLRSGRDIEHSNSTFSGDPMRFWWLAKLCLGLHFYRHRIRENSEFALSPNTGGTGDAQDRMQIQSKVLNWWFRLRHQDDSAQPTHGSLLSRVMKRMDGS